MSRETKLTYYRGSGMQPTLAARYYRNFLGARTLLDVGCGTGAFGRHRPHDGLRIFGVDVDEGALERAAEFEEVSHVDLERDQLPYADASFDGILAKDVLEHLHDPVRVVREMRRVLRPGGIVIASLVMARPRAVWSDYTHVRGFTRQAAMMLLEDVGLTVEAVWRMGPVPLANRFNFMDIVPWVLAVPGPAQLWGTSWELRARKEAHL